MLHVHFNTLELPIDYWANCETMALSSFYKVSSVSSFVLLLAGPSRDLRGVLHLQYTYTI